MIDSKLDLLMKNGIRRGEVDALTSEIDSADLEQDQPCRRRRGTGSHQRTPG